ncbi:hypothetical protein QTP70_029513, partial [Hemibagrus guttatus]
RFVDMLMKDDAELDLAFNFRIDGFDYVVFATTGKMRCLCCGDPDPDRTTKDSDTNSEDMVNDPAVQQLAEMNRTEADPGVEPLKERTGADESAEARSILADNVDTDIRKKAVEFYGSLYWSEVSGEHSTDSGFYKNLPQLTEETNASLKGAVSMGELHKALQSMKAGKAPGIDGLPVDFYKSLWEVVGEDVLLGAMMSRWPVCVRGVCTGQRGSVLVVSHCAQLFRRDPKAFPGQPKDIVSPACPGSSPGPLPGGACPEHLSRETSWRHPKQMPEPPRLPPFDVEKQRLYSELLPGDRAPPG